MSETEIVLLVLLLQAVFTACLGIYMYLWKKKWLTRSYETNGEVVDFRLERFANRSSHMSAHPIIRYKTPEGGEVTFRCRQGRTSWNFVIGDSVEILVNRHDPEDAELKGFMSQWFVPFCCAMISFHSLLIVVLAWLFVI